MVVKEIERVTVLNFNVSEAANDDGGRELMTRLYKQCKAYKNSLMNSTTWFENGTEAETPLCPVVFDG